MPNVSYDGQSFLVNGRRIWLCGASLPYALIPPSEWKTAISAVAEAGFNIVETAAPWLLHEPRPGRFDFSGELDVRRFITMCGDAGLRVLLRAGPWIGGTIDGGGLPGWLAEIPGMAIRQGSEPFLERAGLFYHKLLEPLADLQVTQPQPGAREGGPLLLVQLEHGWHCANDEQGRKYLQELVRYARECGLTIPLLTANDLWQDVEGTIETWAGSRDLLVNLRQLRAVQSNAPRLVTSFDPAGFEIWGEAEPEVASRDEAMLKLGQIFAAGGQPFVAPFHPGANFGFLGGRLVDGPAGPAGRFACTRAAVDPPLDEAGRRGTKYAGLKRLVSFATSFGHVLAELDPDYHPIVVDVESVSATPASRDAGKAGRAAAAEPAPQLSVVPLQGTQGRVVFVFTAAGAPRSLTLLLENGVRMPIALGDQPLGWYLLDVDLLGNGHLDYCNLCPTLLVDRSVLVVHGPAKSAGYVSINGGPIEATVPVGCVQPLVVDNKGITVVICNQEQIDATYHDQEHVYVGCAGFDPDGRPILDPRFAKVWRIGKNAVCKVAPSTPQPKPAAAPTLGAWSHSSSAALAAGTSQRFATLDGPASLVACGAANGYGWYRLRVGGTGKRTILFSSAGDRLHKYVDGKLERILGCGPGGTAPIAPLAAKAKDAFVFLADNFGRFCEGNDAGERKGLPGPVYEVKPLRGIRMKRVEAGPADPFKLRGFIANRAVGQVGSTTQVQWTFTHRRKAKLAVRIAGLHTAGTLVVNGVPAAYYAGEHGATSLVATLDPSTTKGFKQGINVLRFSPDPPLEHAPRLDDAEAGQDPAKFIEFFEVLREHGSPGEGSATSSGSGGDLHWSFARWEPPPPHTYQRDDKPAKGAPCWWRCEFETKHPQALWISATGLSKGVMLVNGRAIGRYFSATQAGKPVGPQGALYVPAAWQRSDGPNELLIFDEHGFGVSGVKLSAK